MGSAGRRPLADLLLERHLVAAERIEGLVMAGLVRINGEVAKSPRQLVSEQDLITVTGDKKFVSRGGDKLAAALTQFAIDPTGWCCADVGAATGGFTDALLQRGAAKVFAVDVGYGDLHWKARSDPRVVPIERTNVRELAQLPEQPRLVVIDVSFISLRLVLPVIANWLLKEGEVVALIKPQFEAPRDQVPDGGVVRDPAVHRQLLLELLPRLSELSPLEPG